MTDYKFCTDADVKALLPIASGWSGFDALIGRCIVQATLDVQQFCRRTFVHAVYTEYFPTRFLGVSDRSQRFWLKEMFVDSGASLTLSVASFGDWTGQPDLILGTEFLIDYDKGLIEVICPLPSTSRGLRVAYSAGFPVDGSDPTLVLVNASLKQATAIQAGFLVDRFAANESMMLDKQGPGRTQPKRMSVSAVFGLAPQARQLANVCRRTLVGGDA